MGDFSERVFDIVRQIPAGKVATYGLVAQLMGRLQSARYVGFALRNNPSPAADGGTTPAIVSCLRMGVSAKALHLAGPGVQRKLLEAEGVAFLDDSHIDLGLCLWDGKGAFSPGPEEAFPDAPTTPPDDFDWIAELGED